MSRTITVVVVSHQDLRAHKNANELINVQQFSDWRQSHHECTFTPSDLDGIDSQMRRAVTEHAKKFCGPYGLSQEVPLDVYPFLSSHDVYRPSKLEWNLHDPASNQFVFVSPSILNDENHSLLFVKFFNSRREMKFCGTLEFCEDEIIFGRFQHLRRLCDINNAVKIQLLNVFSQTSFCHIDVHRSFKDQSLQTGSIVVVQEGMPSSSTEPRTGLALPPYGIHDPALISLRDTIGESLYRQKLECQYIDFVLCAAPDAQCHFSLNGHKNVLATVPYFKAAFESGMKETKGTESNPNLIELVAPPWTNRSAMESFLSFVYLRNSSQLSQLTVESLSMLIRVADYYGFEELIEAVTAVLEDRYTWLTEQNALGVLDAIELLHFSKKALLEKLVMEYVVCNFSRVARRKEFHDLFGKNVYNSIIDAVSKASWEKRIRN